jgi:hypothetical protein
MFPADVPNDLEGQSHELVVRPGRLVRVDRSSHPLKVAEIVGAAFGRRDDVIHAGVDTRDQHIPGINAPSTLSDENLPQAVGVLTPASINARLPVQPAVEAGLQPTHPWLRATGAFPAITLSLKVAFVVVPVFQVVGVLLVFASSAIRPGAVAVSAVFAEIRKRLRVTADGATLQNFFSHYWFLAALLCVSREGCKANLVGRFMRPTYPATVAV